MKHKVNIKNKKNKKPKTTPRHILTKLLKPNDMEKNLKPARENRTHSTET